jgi:hypothetical protein
LCVWRPSEIVTGVFSFYPQQRNIGGQPPKIPQHLPQQSATAATFQVQCGGEAEVREAGAWGVSGIIEQYSSFKLILQSFFAVDIFCNGDNGWGWLDPGARADDVIGGARSTAQRELAAVRPNVRGARDSRAPHPQPRQTITPFLEPKSPIWHCSGRNVAVFPIDFQAGSVMSICSVEKTLVEILNVYHLLALIALPQI